VAADAPLVRIGDRRERFESASHAVGLVLAAFVVGGAFAAGGRELLAATAAGDPLVEAGATAASFLGFLLVGAAYLDWRGEPPVGFGRPTRRDAAVTGLGTVALVGLMFGLETLFSQLGLSPADNATIEAAREQPRLFLYYVPVAVALVAPAEELLFRGLVQGLFRRSYGVAPGIVIAAVVFGLVHYPALTGAGSSEAYVLVVVLAGAVLGIAYEYTHNLLVPIAVHAAWNAVVYLVGYYGAVGVAVPAG